MSRLLSGGGHLVSRWRRKQQWLVYVISPAAAIVARTGASGVYRSDKLPSCCLKNARLMELFGVRDAH